MISDEEAVRLANDYKDVNLLFDSNYPDVQKLARKVLELLERQRWIPVSENPTENGRYIVFVKNGCLDGDCSYIATFEQGHGWLTQTPSYWMPLPPPPEQP